MITLPMIIQGYYFFYFWITLCWLFLFLATIYREVHCSVVPLRPEELRGGEVNFCSFWLDSSLFFSVQCTEIRRRIASGKLVGAGIIHHHRLFASDTDPHDTVTILRRSLSSSSASVSPYRDGYSWRFGRHNFLSCTLPHILKNTEHLWTHKTKL